MRKRMLKFFVLALVVVPVCLLLTSSANSGGSVSEQVTTDHFQVQWGGTNLGFHSVEGLESRVEVLEYRDGLSPVYEPKKYAGKIHNSNIILRRVYEAQDNELWDWYSSGTLRGTPIYRDLTISILNRSHEPVVTFKITSAWPCAYRGPVLNAHDKQLALEEVEIAYQSMTVEND